MHAGLLGPRALARSAEGFEDSLPSPVRLQDSPSPTAKPNRWQAAALAGM